MVDESIRVEEIDVRGQVCPSTLLVALDYLNQHQEEISRGRLRVLIKTDNRDATTTIPGTAGNMGYESEVVRRDGYYEISVYRPG